MDRASSAARSSRRVHSHAGRGETTTSVGSLAGCARACPAPAEATAASVQDGGGVDPGGANAAAAAPLMAHWAEAGDEVPTLAPPRTGDQAQGAAQQRGGGAAAGAQAGGAAAAVPQL